jgi:PAS domain S-box-containing protein
VRNPGSETKQSILFRVMNIEQPKELNHLLFNIPYGVVVVGTRNFLIQYCNYHQVLNLNSRKIENQNFFYAFPDLDTPDFASVLDKAQRVKSVSVIKCFERKAVGGVAPAIYLDITISPVMNDPGDESLLITFSDVSAHVIQHLKESLEEDTKLSSILQREIATLQAFQQREEIFRLLIENSKDGIAILSKKGEVIYVSPSVQSIMGYTESEAIELNVLSLIYNEDATQHKKLFEVFFTKKSISNEIRIRHKAGRYIWIEYSITNFLNTPGINAIVINFRDVTERKNAQEMISANEKKLRNLADAMPQLVWMADSNGKVTYYNGRIHEYAGAKPLADHTWEWSPLLHGDDIDSTRIEWEASLREKKIYYKEHRAQMADGTYRYHLSRAYPQFDKEGNVTTWFGTATDIHEQKQAQVFLETYAAELEQKVNQRTAELKKEKDFAETILDSSIDEIVVYDTETRLINANRKFYEKFQIKKENALGKKLLEIFPQAIEGNGRVIAALMGEARYFPAQYWAATKSFYESFMIPLKDSDSNTYAVLVTVHDVTENIRNEELLHIAANKLKDANESLLRKNQELEQFAYIASHDLQEPLRKITTFANLLEKSKDTDENFHRYIQKIMESSGRMSKLISDVLQYSQLDHKGVVTSVDLNDVFRYIQTDLDLLIEQKNATIKVPHLPTIEGVNRQLTQLFYNLLSNALKFTKNGEPASIEVRSKPVEKPGELNLKTDISYYQISVADNGIGFSQEYADRIFQMFHRLNSREQYGGSGIGLAMVKKIASKHNGLIWVESTEGHGSTFNVVLPTVQPSSNGEGL